MFHRSYFPAFSVIIRLMDDYIMISTRPDAVKRFLEIAHSK